MGNFKSITILFSIALFLVGCAYDTARQKDAQPTAFKRTLEENTQQCRSSIEKAEFSQISSKIFWVSGFSEPTMAMQDDAIFVQEKEKPEIERLHKVIDFCQGMYSRTIMLFINEEYGEYFKKHRHTKHRNLNDLHEGKIAYGTYNRREVGLSKQLIDDLRFLDERYRFQPARQPIPEPEFQRSSQYLRLLLIEILLLSMLVL